MLKTFFVTTLILCSVLGSPILADDATKDQKSTPTLRDTLSGRLLKYMNESVDPCESFYEFACGNWKTHHPATESNQYTRSFDLPPNIFYGKVAQLLTTPPTQRDTKAELKVKDFYESCLSFTSLSSTDYKEKLLEIMAEFGQMPALIGDEWQEQDFDWLKTVAEISHKYGINIILGHSIEDNLIDHTTYLIRLACKNDKLQNEKEDIKSITDNLEAFLEMDKEIAGEVGRQIATFASNLAAASTDTEEKTSMDDLYTKYLPDLDVQQLFNISFGYLPTGVIHENCDVHKLIDVVNQTPKRVVANYIFYQLLEPFMLFYPKNKTELAEECLLDTLKYFPHIVTFMFYRANEVTEKENYVGRMWQDMKTTWQIMLESSQLSWFDDVTREFALEKLHSMKMVVALYKENHFDEEYSQLYMKKHDLLENLKSLNVFNAAKTRASLNMAPNHIDNGLDLYSPYYFWLSNSMVIPVSTLATDFSFSPLYPKAINFADVGAALGHEAMHGFSAGGRKYNKLGNFVGNWSANVEKEYDERRQCLYDQYSNYTVGGKPLPQDESQSENLADIAGILVAYETYRRWYEDSARTEEELSLETLPNLNYTSKQLFFIASAQVWCADVYEGGELEMSSADVHTPDKFRAFVPLTNIDGFSNVFKCAKGSPMNPEKQCSII